MRHTRKSCGVSFMKRYFMLLIMGVLLCTVGTGYTAPVQADNSADVRIPAADNEITEGVMGVQIKLGRRYNKINKRLGEPLEVKTLNKFWGHKDALYRISPEEYCIIHYTFNRVKNVLFLEDVSEEKVKEHFRSNLRWD